MNDSCMKYEQLRMTDFLSFDLLSIHSNLFHTACQPIRFQKSADADCGLPHLSYEYTTFFFKMQAFF